MNWAFVHSKTWLLVVTLFKARVSENVKVFITNQNKYLEKQRCVGHNLDPMKIFLFTPIKVFNISLQSKENSLKNVQNS